MSGPLENLDSYRQSLARIFERHGVLFAYLYGSQARGGAGPLSDVDVAVLFDAGAPTDARFDRVLRLIGELGSVLRRDDVSVVDLAAAPPLLRHRVYHDGQLLYCADKSALLRFQMAALRDYVDTEPLRRIKRQYVLRHFNSQATGGA